MSLQVNLVLEILGRPAEHIKEALLSLVTRIQDEKGVKVTSKKINDPIPVENTDLFTSFVELSLEVEDVATYLSIIFAYLPAHIEITSPEKLTMSNSDLNNIGNALAKRLHDYDAVAKRMIADKDVLLKKLYEVAPQMFKQAPQAVHDELSTKANKDKTSITNDSKDLNSKEKKKSNKSNKSKKKDKIEKAI